MIVKVDRITTHGEEHIVTMLPLDLVALETGLCDLIEVACNNEGVKKFIIGRVYDVQIKEVEQH